MTVDSKGTIYVLYEVKNGTTVNLARLNYDCLVADSKASLANLSVTGASEELDFSVGTCNYTINAISGDTVTINAQALVEGATMTINGAPYNSGDDYKYEVAIGGEPVEIKITNGDMENTYTITFAPYAPAFSMVMHLNGESYQDQTIYQNNATASGTVVLSTEQAAFDTGSYAFDGSATNKPRMDVSPTNGIDVATENFTVSAWYYTNTTSGQHIIFWYGGYNASQPQFWCRTNGTSLQCCVASDGIETVLTASNAVTTGTWHHVVIIHNGVNIYMYQDNELVASATSSLVHNINGEDGLTIGMSRNPSASARVVNGYLDEIKIFNYALNTEQIDSLYKTNTLPVVHVTGVTLDQKSANLVIGDKLPLTATVNPANADDVRVTWSSDNEAVATIDENGVVTAIAEGDAVITVTTTDGGYSASCAVKVDKTELDKAQEAAVAELAEYVALTDLAEKTEELTADTTAEQVDELVAVSKAARDAIEAAETEEAVAEIIAAAVAEMEAITEILCAGEEFTDVDVNEWYHDAIDFVINEGMMSGNGDGTFAPEAELSRAMLVQILYNIEGKPEVETDKSFSDVTEDDWYYDAVMWAAENGIVLGNDDGTYAPNDNITREQMVTILYRYADSPELEDAAITFADAADVDDYAKNVVIWAVANKIVQGVGNNKLNPDGNSTRAETAQVMLNYFGK